MTKQYTSLEHSIRTIMEGRSNNVEPSKTLEQSILEGGHTLEGDNLQEVAPAALAIPAGIEALKWGGAAALAALGVMTAKKSKTAAPVFKTPDTSNPLGMKLGDGTLSSMSDKQLKDMGYERTSDGQILQSKSTAPTADDLSPASDLPKDKHPETIAGAPPNIGELPDLPAYAGKDKHPETIAGAAPGAKNTGVAAPPVVLPKTAASAATDTAAAVADATKKPPKDDKPKKRGRFGLPGFSFNVQKTNQSTPGQASGVGTYMHKAGAPLRVSEENEADTARISIENVARLNSRRDKAVKQQEIQKKILDEKRSLADTVRRNVEETKEKQKVESPIITNPELKRPEPEGINNVR